MLEISACKYSSIESILCSRFVDFLNDPMGCAGSKNSIKEKDMTTSRPAVAPKSAREKRENVEVENGAIYSGEMIGAMKDGLGSQKCMLS